MKKLTVFLLLMLLILPGCAPAAPQSPTPITPTPPAEQAPSAAPALWQALDISGPFEADLDGDGTPETIEAVADEETYTARVTITKDGVAHTDEGVSMRMFLEAHLGDAKTGDGHVELYLMGDEASSDHVTLIYRLMDGQLQKTEIYGVVTDTDGSGEVDVGAVVDVLGTYGASCRYALQDDFTFALCTPYTLQSDAEDWDWRKIVVKRDGLPVQALPGNTAAELPAGTELLLLETDEASYAIVENKAGERFSIAISESQDLWGWEIGGLQEENWFEELRYAG